MASRFSQRGGTLLGFLIGLTVGVAASAYVVYRMNHDSLPILDGKYLARPSADKNEEQRTANWDPNRKINPAYTPSTPVASSAESAPATAGATTTEPIKATNNANRAVSAPTVTTTTTTTTPSGSATSGTVHPAPTASAPMTAPAAGAATTKPSAAAQATANAYYLQIGSYKSRQSANEQVAQLALQGFDATVTQTTSGGAEVFRVRMGPYASMADLKRVKGKLGEAGISAFEVAPSN